jgi:hypothetical protein
MIADRSPLAMIYTALAFGIVVAPYCFFGLLMEEEDPLRLYTVFTLLACTSILALRLVGWSKPDGWLAQRQNTIARMSIHAVTAIAFLCSCYILISLAALGVMFTQPLTWFYVLVAWGLCAIVALLPIIFLKPSRFERAFSSRLTSKLNTFRLAAYGFLVILAVFACAEVIKFYHFTHPVY